MGKYAVLSTELKRLMPLIRQGVGSTVLWLRCGRSTPDSSALEYAVRRIIRGLREGKAEAYCRIEGDSISGLIIWEVLDWDTRILGIGCGRIHLVWGGGLDELLFSWKDRIDQAGIEYVTCRVASPSRVLENAGFAGLEEMVYLTGPSSVEFPSPDNIREAGEADLERIRYIAGRAYFHDRFHSDPLFSDDDAGRVHSEWAESSLLGRADCVLAADPGGTVEGFCACILPEEGSGNPGWIDMLAVSTGSRRRGIGEQLVLAARNYFAIKGISSVALCTQRDNLPAVNLYHKNGFRIFHAAVTYRIHTEVRANNRYRR